MQVEELQRKIESGEGAVVEDEACEHEHEKSEPGFRAGTIPPVLEEQPAPPQPSASDRAYGGRAAGRAAATGKATVAADALGQPVEYMLHGVRIVAQAGVRASAISKVAAIITQMLARNEIAQDNLSGVRATIVIIPASKKMTDLAQFSGLRGQRTPDGRPWENVRGSGGMRAGDGSFAIGVAEENLVNVPGVKSEYREGYSIAMHELAHTVESKGMTEPQKQRLNQLYDQQKNHDAGDFSDSYAARNKHEYFAQATNAFFGTNDNGKDNKNGRAWLQQADPDMYAFLVEMYETRHEREEKKPSA